MFNMLGLELGESVWTRCQVSSGVEGSDIYRSIGVMSKTAKQVNIPFCTNDMNEYKLPASGLSSLPNSITISVAPQASSLG